MSIDGQIENAGALTGIFGEWPWFHDAEIISIRLERGPERPSLEAVIHVFRMTDDVDDRGFFVLTNHTLVTIRFDGIVLYDFKWFNHQNVIDGLEIGPATNGEGRFAVEMPSNAGCEARFDCDAIVVIAAVPFAPAGASDVSGVTLLRGRPGSRNHS